MPELPDVEGFRGVAAEHGAGRTVRDVRVADPRVLHGATARSLRETLTGRTLGEPERRGKWLVVPFSGGPVLLVHFGMTGSLIWADAGAERHRHDRVTFVLDDGELRYRDMRKLHGMWLAADREAADRLLARVGPDSLAIPREEFDRAMAGRRQVKAALLDQSALSGLGNLLADEICWRARIHPRRHVDRLSDVELRRLHTSMRRVLREAVPTGHVPGRRSWLTGHRADPLPACPRCGTALSRGRIAGRTTYWCPRCQPETT